MDQPIRYVDSKSTKKRCPKNFDSIDDLIHGLELRKLQALQIRF